MSGSESSVMLLIFEALLVIAIIWVLQRMILFGQLVYSMLSVPRIPERFPFSLPLDLILDMRRMSRSVKNKPNGRVPLTKLKAYPRMFFKLLDTILPKYYDQPVIGFFYGPVAFISAVTPEAAEAILSSPKYLNKTFLYHFMEPWLGRGLLTKERVRNTAT